MWDGSGYLSLLDLSAGLPQLPERFRNSILLSYFGTALAVTLALALVLGVSFLVNRLWPIHIRRQCSEIVAAQLGILGTIYAVILGFMIFNVWTEFRTASMDVGNEASAMVEVYRAADNLPDPQRSIAKSLAHQYGEATIRSDWPAMETYNSGSLPPEGARILARLWALQRIPAGSALDHIAAYQQFGNALIHLHQQRRVREEQYRSHLPIGLWLLLISGAVLVVGAACLLGSDREWLHYAQVLSLAFVVLLTLGTIADIDHPFAGCVRVDDTSFQDALAVIDDPGSQSLQNSSLASPGEGHALSLSPTSSAATPAR